MPDERDTNFTTSLHHTRNPSRNATPSSISKYNTPSKKKVSEMFGSKQSFSNSESIVKEFLRFKSSTNFHYSEVEVQIEDEQESF